MRLLIPLLTALLGVGCGPVEGPPSHASASDDSTWARTQAADALARLNASEGGRLLLRAIEAHGGLEAWYAAPTSSYTWEYANQGGDFQFKTFLVADNRTRLMYHDILTYGSYGNPDRVDARMAWNGEEAWISPASFEGINPRFWSSTGYYFEQIPFVLADPGTVPTIMEPAVLDGEVYDMVEVGFEAGVGDAPGDTYKLYVDQETGQVEAIRYTVTYGREVDPETPPQETLLRYGEYTTVDGLTVAQHFKGYLFVDGDQGAFKNEAFADSISFRRPFDESRLVKPEDARIAPAPEG